VPWPFRLAEKICPRCKGGAPGRSRGFWRWCAGRRRPPRTTTGLSPSLRTAGAHGYSNDFGTRGGAEERALQECGAGCEVVLWFKDACGALAVGAKNVYGTGWASGRRQAENIAMSNCNKNAASCGVRRWVCTTR